MNSSVLVARSAMYIAIGIAVVGILVLFGGALAEVLTDPSLTLEDGYWIGRLPWTPVGVGLVVMGSTTVVLAGTLSVLLVGGNIRRVLTIVVSLPTLFWWLVEAFQLQGVSGGCMDGACFRPLIDPITYAYSMPEWTIELLLLPALVVTALALASPRRSAPVSRAAGPTR